MKVILINGSPHNDGCTFTALCEVDKTLKTHNIATEIINIGTGAIYSCIACGECNKLGKCVFDDDLCNLLLSKMKDADGIVVGSPVYFAGPRGALCSILERMFFAGGDILTGKPAAAVLTCRRSGSSAAFDRINKFFSYNQMPIVTSQNWNTVHGNTPEEVLQDAEGLQIMRTLGNNMAWLIKTISAGKIPAPKREEYIETNFIR